MSVGPREVSVQLRDGMNTLDSALLDAVARVLPQGEYRVSLLMVRPLKVTPGSGRDYFSNEQVQLWGRDPFFDLPHTPRVQYYRTSTRAFGQQEGLFEFVIPMYPWRQLDEATLAHYQERIAAGEQPTAMALSVLDIKQPANWEEPQPVTKHWCLAHYLIDGHHKTYAASIWHRPITLLSFLAVDECLASEVEIDRLFELLASA
jgi:hypothetical protein